VHLFNSTFRTACFLVMITLITTPDPRQQNRCLIFNVLSESPFYSLLMFPLLNKAASCADYEMTLLATQVIVEVLAKKEAN